MWSFVKFACMRKFFAQLMDSRNHCIPLLFNSTCRQEFWRCQSSYREDTFRRKRWRLYQSSKSEHLENSKSLWRGLRLCRSFTLINCHWSKICGCESIRCHQSKGSTCLPKCMWVIIIIIKYNRLLFTNLLERHKFPIHIAAIWVR